MANNTVGSLSTNLNTAPYFDDFNGDKNFYRILFKPGMAVQARELTQLQSIQQKQIDRFAEHIFKEGSLVSGGQFIIDKEFYYVKLNDADDLSTLINVNDFVGKTVTGLTSEVVMQIFFADIGSEANPNKKTLYGKIVKAGLNGTTKTFEPGETIVTADEFRAVVFDDPESIGKTSIFQIESGVLFAKDHFVSFPKQSIILERYSDKPTFKVGFDLEESIVDYIDDNTLLDPAQGSYNFNAPGADRLKITATLAKYALDEEDITDFVELYEIKDGIIQEKFEKPQYSIIRDELARRTEDESGDYYVKGLNVTVREHLDTGSNGGLFVAPMGNSSLLSVGVDPGKAYVKGYDFETLVTKYATTLKGLDFNNVEQQVVSTNYANYIIVNELTGNFSVNIGEILEFYTAAQTRVSTRNFSTTAQTGTLIGNAKIKHVELLSGNPGTASAQYKIYIYDVKITNSSYKFSDIRSVYLNNTGTADAGADIVLDGGIAVLYEPEFNFGIYDTNVKSIRKLRDASENIDTTYSFNKSFTASMATNGTFTISTGLVDEIFAYSVGALNSSQKAEFVVVANASTTIAQTGTVTVNSGSPTVTGSGTFFTRLNVGDVVSFNTVGGTYTIASIASDTSMTLTSNSAGTAAGVSYVKNIVEGMPINFNGIGSAAGTTRTITVSTTTSALFDIKETIAGVITVNVLVKLNKVDAREIAKILRSDRYVLIDCNTAGVNGPFNLGVADIYRLKDVRKANSFATVSDGVSVLSNFILDNGQRDVIYDHGSIIPKNITLTSADKLLVKFDYFVPDYSQGTGYFSVDSYPVDDVNGPTTTTIRTENIPIYSSKTTNRIYDLRNCIDTRPVKTQTAADVVSLTGISTNPATSNTFQYGTGGLRTPVSGEQFTVDFSYYLPRTDILVANKEGNFRIIKGVSAAVPITPQTPSDSMKIATLKIAPFPSLSSNYAASLKRLDLANLVDKSAYKRYTMREIGVLDKRISNLEYYQALSLLEKSAIDLKIPDENGLDRFKNGIFVDPFNDHTLGDLGNPDYSIAVDPIEKVIRPKFKSDTLKSVLLSNTNVVMKNNVAMLPYTEVEYTSQNYATGTRNAAGFFWNFKGKMELNPSTDYWADTETVPSIQVSTGPSAASWQALSDATGTIWNDWQTTWTGVTTERTNTTITTTTSSEQRRDRVVTDVITTTQVDNLGERVIDVGVIPHMRSRQIRFSAWGLQPNARVYPFFDGEDVSDYCAQSDSEFGIINALGTNLTVDSNGEVYGVFMLPNDSNKKFRVGDRLFKLTDSLTNGNDSITTASATYSASGLVQQKQSTFLTTVNAEFSTRNETEIRTTTNTDVATIFVPPVVVPPVNPVFPWVPNDVAGGGADGGGGAGDPIAQTFSVNLSTSTHMFATSIDLFFQTKSSTLGATLELREVDPAGYITSKIIPYSVVYKNHSDIQVSETGTLATKFEFNTPICLTSGQQYALVLIPEQNNPDYRLFTARLGENDLVTNNRITAQPHSGIFFVSSNAKTWSPIQDEDMKFVIRRANFTTGVAGNLQIKNQPREYVEATTYSGPWTQIGEDVYGEARLTLGTITGGTIIVGDKILKDSVSYIITNISGSVYRVKGAGTFSITPGAISILDSSDVPKGITSTIISKTQPIGYLYKSYTNSGTFTIIVENLSSAFVVGEEIRGRITSNTATVASFGEQDYSVCDFETSMINFPSTNVIWRTRCVNNVGAIDSQSVETTANENLEFNVVKTIYGLNYETNTLAAPSLLQTAQLISYNSYVSPIVDLNRTFNVIVHNLVNNDSTGETNTSGGNILNKYISQKINLDDGNSAEDLKVYISAYRPPNSDIKLYVKLLNAEDSEPFDVKNWIELSPATTNVFSSEQDSKNYREYVFDIPASMKTGSNGEVQYTNAAGVTFTGFKNYMIKIGLLSTNPAIPPKVTDLRCIGLQI